MYSPNKDYTGVSASVPFCGGVGETDEPYLLDWFKKHGYTVEESESVKASENAETSEKSEELKAPSKKSPPRKAGERYGI